VHWLLPKSEPGFYAKNHMIGVVTFVQPYVIQDVPYYAARISMEIGFEKKVAEIVAQEVCVTHISIPT